MKHSILFIVALAFSLCTNAQDDCFSALPIEAGLYTVDAIDGASPPSLDCNSGSAATHAEWYVYSSPQAQLVTITTDLLINSGLDTRVNVFVYGCDFDICEGGDDNSGSGDLCEMTFSAMPNTVYHIVFDDSGSDVGFDFELIEEELGGGLLSFTSEANSPSVLATVDMNGDMLDDLVSATSTSVTVKYQLSTGGFETETFSFPSAQNSPSWSLAAADYDENGYTDLLYGGGSGVSIMKRTDDGTSFTEVTTGDYVFSQRSNFVDIDNDGNLDAFVCHDVEPNVYYINDGSGGVTFYQGGLGDTPDGGNYGSVWIDYDNDCDMDLFLAKCRGGVGPANINQLHRNNGDGTFTEVGPTSGLEDNVQTWSSAWGDYDNDGDLDCYVGASSTSNGSHKMMENNGDGTFTDITEGTGFDTFAPTSTENACSDFNNDGYIDILAAGNTIMLNNGDWTFTPVFTGFSNASHGDINNDGFMDVVGFSMNINNGNDNNYIKVHTEGVVSNLEGIGCRITISSALGNQIREIRSGEGFRYMSSLNAHFGIGTDEAISVVKVHWPSGIIDVIENPPINTTINVVEGSTVVGVDELASERMTLSPNPAVNVISVQSDDIIGTTNAAIFDLSGKRVYNDPLTNGTIDVSALASGNYILRIESNGKLFKKQFTKE
jgi:hypothetical protein